MQETGAGIRRHPLSGATSVRCVPATLREAQCMPRGVSSEQSQVPVLLKSSEGRHKITPETRKHLICQEVRATGRNKPESEV